MNIQPTGVQPPSTRDLSDAVLRHLAFTAGKSRDAATLAEPIKLSAGKKRHALVRLA